MQIIRVRLCSEETKGCEQAPIEVLKVLKGIENSEAGKVIDFNKLNLEEIHVNLDDKNEAHYLIFENSKEIFEKNSKSFFIGGDQSIDYSILRAFDKIQDDGLLIVFDGRGDCIGSELSNRTWLRKLIENGFSGSRIVLVGVRDIGLEETEFLKENQVTIIKMDLLQEDLEGICDLVMERARDSKGFYISLDIGIVDPGFAPGVSFGSIGGLSSREMIYFIKRLMLLGNFRGSTISEINVDKDINGITVGLSGKILGEMI